MNSPSAFRLVRIAAHSFALILLASGPRSVALPIREIPNPALNDVAEANFDPFGPVIYYNPTRLAAAGRDAAVFFRAHEYAHHWLRHLVWRQAATQVGLRHPYSRQAELEADCFATQMLAWQNPRAVQAAIRYFESQGDRSLDADHPTGAQRARNIRGCLSQERDDPSAESVVPESEPFVPFKAQDSDPGALGDLEFVTNHVARDQELLEWNTDGHPPTVDLKFRFRNRGARAIRCEVILACGTAPKKDSGGGANMSEWIPFYTRKVTVTIPARTTKDIEEQLFWQLARPKNTMPSVRFPIPLADLRDLLVKATYLDRRDSDDSFCPALTRIVEARHGGFEGVKAPGSGEKDDDGDYTWRSSVILPGSLEASIATIDKEAQYDALIYKDSDASAVEARFATFVAQLRACLGDGWTERRRNARAVAFHDRAHPDSGSVNVRCSSKVDRVELTVYSK